MTGLTIHDRMSIMSNSGFMVGDRVVRLDDGTVGVVEASGSGGSIDVRWDPSGVIQAVVPGLLKKV